MVRFAHPGQQVRDFPSNSIRTIVKVEYQKHLHCNFYDLDSTTPLDPTGDGAFSDRTRCDHEVGPADQPRPQDWSY